MSNKNHENMTDHDFDGIRECDNPMPTWWLWTFFLTIIFGAIYFLHYQSGAGLNSMDEFRVKWRQYEQNRKTALAARQKAQPSQEDLAARLKSPEVIELGGKVYVRACQACHGDQLQGMIGPNLVDEYWIHGQGKPDEIMTVIKTGVLDKGMPPWEQALKPDEIVAVTSFILSKKGSRPAGAKAPQGTAYPDYLTSEL